jgi:hypothetical protein
MDAVACQYRKAANGGHGPEGMPPFTRRSAPEPRQPALTLVGLNAGVIAGWLGFEIGLAGATVLYAGTGRLIASRG